MRTKHFLLPFLCASVLSLGACQNQQWVNTAAQVMQAGGGMLAASNASGLSSAEISNGLKEALRVGSGLVVNQLGQNGGFSLDNMIRIPLPNELQTVDRALSAIGMGGLTSNLENSLNRAAELATPKAKAIFMSAIQNMTIEDAYSILTGPNNAATQYLRGATGNQILTEMMPIIHNAMGQAGAIQLYDQVMGQANQIPFLPDVKGSLNNYVAEKTLDGIFHYVAQEELKIRTNPAARTTELLQKVFAAQ